MFLLFTEIHGTSLRDFLYISMYYEKWLDFIAIFHNFCKLILRSFPIYVAIQRKKTGNTYKMHEYCDTVNCIKIQYVTSNTEDDFKINILPASREYRGFQEVPGTNRSFGHRTPISMPNQAFTGFAFPYGHQ